MVVAIVKLNSLRHRGTGGLGDWLALSEVEVGTERLGDWETGGKKLYVDFRRPCTSQIAE